MHRLFGYIEVYIMKQLIDSMMKRPRISIQAKNNLVINCNN